MAIEATIVEQLQELRRWQIQQQDELIRQQEEQRKKLTSEQSRMYQALSLSVEEISMSEISLQELIEGHRHQDPDLISFNSHDEECASPVPQKSNSASQHLAVNNENNNCRSLFLTVPKVQLEVRNTENDLKKNLDFNNSYNEHDYSSDCSVDATHASFSSEVSQRRRVLIDDLPVPSPKKDFNTMLEERLKDSEAINVQTESKPGLKRPFLKKGEGLARFMPNSNPNAKKKSTMRPRSASYSKAAQTNSSKPSRTTIVERSNSVPKSKKPDVIRKSASNPGSVAQQKLTLKNVPPPRRKARSKLNPNGPMPNSLTLEKKKATELLLDYSSSDLETKNKREMEETRIFELLEDKAENSSFCSTSSTVIAFLQQSTPLKQKALLHSASKNKMFLNDLGVEKLERIAEKTKKDHHQPIQKNNKNQITIDNIGEETLEEIVYTINSNNLPLSQTHKNVKDQGHQVSLNDIGDETLEEIVRTTKLNRQPFLQQQKSSNVEVSLIDLGDDTMEKIVEATKSNQQLFTQMQKNPKDKKISEWNAVPTSKLKNDKTVPGTLLPYGTDVDECYADYPSNQEQNEDENNISLHVRFSEHNEYKTMTDTSSVSSDSQTIVSYINDKGAWSDCSVTPDSSDVESILTSRSKMNSNNNKRKTKSHNYSNGIESDEDENEDLKNDITETENEEANEEENDEENDKENHDDTVRKNLTLQEENPIINQKKENASFFKSELLKTRLLELEQEIEIFRKESAALTLQRQKVQEERTKLQEERISLQRSFKEKEEALEIEKKKTESILQEEKKRLGREKAALESRMKDAYDKAQKSKHERQEIQVLRDQLEELREEISQKESKWSASNARQRSQMRVLQTENSKLKQELEKMQQKKNAKIKKPITSSNTKAIHQINKFLADRKKLSPFKNDYDDYKEEKLFKSPPDSANINNNVDFEVEDEKPEEAKIDNAKILKTVESIARTRDLYEKLLKDATEDFTEVHHRRSDLNQRSETAESMQKQTSRERDLENGEENDLDEELPADKYTSSTTSPLSSRVAQEENEQHCDGEQKNDKDKSPKANQNKQGIREVRHADGRVEYWYPNGNVKKIFPDKYLTKMIYYNGDVRETDKNGTVKYFYAATRTWHTTLPDGLEILEFPDGQVERRSKDSTIEVSFPDGSVRIVQADGSEKWAFRDGTVAETSADGEKILTLPNGQREIHTKDHKRREYPDGTIKLVYPDGIQETRYANGRVRLKDKDGNLIMDTHQ